MANVRFFSSFIHMHKNTSQECIEKLTIREKCVPNIFCPSAHFPFCRSLRFIWFARWILTILIYIIKLVYRYRCSWPRYVSCFCLTVIVDSYSFRRLYAVNLNVILFIYSYVKFNYYPRLFCSVLYFEYVQTYRYINIALLICICKYHFNFIICISTICMHVCITWALVFIVLAIGFGLFVFVN